MSRDETSQVSYHAITPVSAEKKHSRHKSFNFADLLFYMEGNQTRFVKSSDIDIKKLVANTVPESTKKAESLSM